MTEAEWLNSPDGAEVFDHLERSFRARKARLDRKILLYVAAVLRQEGDHTQGGWPELLPVLVRYADGRASGEELEDAVPAESSDPRATSLAVALVHLARYGTALSIYETVHVEGTRDVESLPPPYLRPLVRPGRADLLREVFGNPFRVSSSPFHPAPLDPALASWNHGAVLALARSIYEADDFALLPVLADALEEAGGVATLVEHLRNPDPHVRGCWALDRVLGFS